LDQRISDPRTLTPEQEQMLSTWRQHMNSEFVLKDADAAVATMTANAYVFLAALGEARTGQTAIRDYYANTFLPNIPPDVEAAPLAQTIGADRIIEEMILRFTHTMTTDWILPGVPPTHRRIEVPGVVIIGFEAGKIAYERVYWDQATVLAQAGGLESSMATAGVEAAGRLLKLVPTPGDVARHD
jgi:carboxymethylenebutenolidase